MIITEEARMRGANRAAEKVERVCTICGSWYYVAKTVAGRSKYCEVCREEMKREADRQRQAQLRQERRGRIDRKNYYCLKPSEEWGWVRAQFSEEEVKHMLRMRVFEAGEELRDKYGRLYKIVSGNGGQKLVEVRG